MSTIFLGIQPQNDIAHLMKKLVTIGTKVATTPKGGNHGHTNTITLQPSKTLHTAKSWAENSRKNPNTLKPRVETNTITPQPSKILHSAEPLAENLRKISNTLKPKVETNTITPQPSKTLHSAEPRVKNMRTKD
jgi:hypothetical protein